MEEWERSVWSRVMEPGREAAFPEAVFREARVLEAELKALGLPRLYEKQRQAVALLRGIGVLSGARPGKEPGIPPAEGSRNKRLRRCYHRCRGLMGEYAARGGQPETGLIFQQLERMARELCIDLTGLLGSGG